MRKVLRLNGNYLSQRILRHICMWEETIGMFYLGGEMLSFPPAFLLLTNFTIMLIIDILLRAAGKYPCDMAREDHTKDGVIEARHCDRRFEHDIGAVRRMTRRCKLMRCGAGSARANKHRDVVSKYDHWHCEENDTLSRCCEPARCGARSDSAVAGSSGGGMTN
ncbi:DUF159 family protein [Sesbania bispinosa]|nr:DUF159 family protein [Sesbania bispinosa]